MGPPQIGFMKSDATLPQLLVGVVVLTALIFVGYWIAGLVGALVVVGLFVLSIVGPFLVWKWVEGPGSRAIRRQIDEAFAEKDTDNKP